MIQHFAPDLSSDSSSSLNFVDWFSKAFAAGLHSNFVGRSIPEIYLTATDKHPVNSSGMLVLDGVDPELIGDVYAVCGRLDDSKILDLIRN